MSLAKWLDSRFLVEHQSSREEIADLLAVVERDIKDAAVREVSADRRLGIGYSAIRQLATLALAAEGPKLDASGTPRLAPFLEENTRCRGSI